jgi:hypothetical protein
MRMWKIAFDIGCCEVTLVSPKKEKKKKKIYLTVHLTIYMFSHP